MNPWIAFLVIVTLSGIILIHELGHLLVARAVGVKVERFSIGFGRRLVGVNWGGTDFCLSLLPLGGYVKMAGEAVEGGGPKKPWEYRARPVGQRMAIVLAGPLINYALGFLLFLVIFLVGAPIVSTRIGRVLDRFPAAEAGLQEGDRIQVVNERKVTAWEEVTQAIHSQTDWVKLTVERDGTTLTFELQPSVKEVTNILGVKVRIGMIGITPSEEIQIRRYPFPQAVLLAGRRVWYLTSLTFQALWRIATGGLSIKESITGPIGILYLTSSVAEQGLLSLLQLMAVLSTSLGLFNLLPIPVLDGGHLGFLFLERIKGRPVSLRTQELLTRMALGLLVLLLVVVTYNDLARFKFADRFRSFF